MIQIFAFGSSSVYGVGASKAGWVDLVKQKFHEQMFSPGGEGEKYEVYNFAHPGAPAEFVQDVYPWVLEKYGREGTLLHQPPPPTRKPPNRQVRWFSLIRSAPSSLQAYHYE